MRAALRVFLAAFCLFAAGAATHAGEPLDLVPAESLLCWYGRPLPAGAGQPKAGNSDQPSTVQTLLELGTRIVGSAGGGLDSGVQLSLRMAEMFRLMIRYPHAVALIDARAKPTETDPNARRVDRLRFAMVVRIGEPGRWDHKDFEPFLQIIQKAVNEQTNSGAATLTSHKAHAWTYQELRDERLPDWAAIAWGRIDRYFVLTVGPNVWPSVAAVAAGQLNAISQDPWYATARAKRRHSALVEIFMAADEIQRRLDPFVDGRASDFFRAWDAENLARAHWALGFEGRGLYCLAHFRIGEQTVRRLYADPDRRDAELLAAIPDGTDYAVFDVSVGRFLPRFFRGMLTIQGAKARANIERLWSEIQAAHGFDVERDLLAHLGKRVVLHGYPRHPLHLPLAITTLIEIRDDASAVRRTIDTMCNAWRQTLDGVSAEAAAGKKNPPPFTLHHDADEIWYLRFGLDGPSWLGLAGPAWTTTDRFIILSWSPMALRDYLAKVGDAAGAR